MLINIIVCIVFVSAGIGRIHGRWCMVSANDGTLKGGTYFPIGAEYVLYVLSVIREY